MARELFPHQKTMSDFLSGTSGVKGCFAGMGTGKTLTALEAARKVREAYRDVAVLIVAPPIALRMWQAEAKAWLGGKATILKTGKTPIGDTKTAVVSYNIAQRRARDLGEFVKNAIVIFDESHALKSASAKRTKDLLLDASGPARRAHFTWMLTGTPITRWNDDMFPFLYAADQGGLIDMVGPGRSVQALLERFQKRFNITQRRMFPGSRIARNIVVGNRDTEDLANWVYGDGLAIRVDLEDVFRNMPPLTENRYPIKLHADDELLVALKDVERMSFASIEQKLRQNDEGLSRIRRQMGIAKVQESAAEIAERVRSGQNVLVGAWHREVIDSLMEYMADYGFSCGVIDGRTSAKEKAAIEDEWNAGSMQVCVCQIAAAGVSLNLQRGGSQIIVVEEDWSPAIMDQFYARLWRFGQQRHVHVDTLYAENKLEEALHRISRTKKAEQSKFNRIGKELTDAK